MTKKMLIDAAHPEETRVAIVDGHRLEEFDYETTTKQQLKGNIYLAKVTRVEPSLQAAFVEYGGNRHGFLAFSEIHPDYYRIPVADREDLVEDNNGDDDDGADNSSSVEELGGDEGMEEAVQEAARRRPRLKRHYKIQEVVKRRQVLLVQVIKEERGTKGAALTTYLSMAGRYCVLMPNTSRGGGVSRKITSAQDRKRLKSILSELDLPEGMAVILRTAGGERSKAEIRRDFDYIKKLWDDIRTKTLESTAPALIYEEASLIRRAIRDLYDKEIEEILVAGDESYRVAKDFMKAMIPSHAKKVQPYKDDDGTPLFHRYKIESQLDQVFDPTVLLRSGGSIVMHQTEALVAIDVNSGKSTRERHIEETALKTNLEAAEEVARQLRLRDLAGLIVIDFIDMEENRNQHAVERKLKEALRRDRARIQVGRISPFGLLEMSRQRLRPSILEAMSQPCVTCGGLGHIPSTESAALRVLRSLEEEGLRKRSDDLCVKVPPAVALYILNHKRRTLAEMEEAYDFSVVIETDDDLIPPNFSMVRLVENSDGSESEIVIETSDGDSDNNRNRGGGRKRRSRRKRRFEEDGDGGSDSNASRNASQQQDTDDDSETEESSDSPREQAAASSDSSDDSEGGRSRRRRKRGRRGGKRRRGREDNQEAANDSENQAVTADNNNEPSTESDGTAASEEAQSAGDGDAPAEETAKAKPSKRSRSRRKPKQAAAAESEGAETPSVSETEPASDASTDDAAATISEEQPAFAAASPEEPAEKPKKRRSPRKKAAARKADAPEATAESTPEPAGETSPDEGISEAESAPSNESTPVQADNPQPEPEPSQDVQPEPQQSAEEEAASSEPPKPKRSGWWNKAVG
ncbi:MAG: Rne/Rng family ribonuclease [Alphaproteobacteria bacterium]